jgi:hypothetical protein
MSNLAIEIENAGIDYREVDLEDVSAFMDAYQEKTGHDMTLIEAIKYLYEGGEPCRISGHTRL